MIGVQTVKNHKNSDSSVCCTLGVELTRASLATQLTSGVDVFAHVWVQALDTQQLL